MGDENGNKAFEFLSQNLGVTKDYGGIPNTRNETMEWSLTQYGKAGRTGINVVSTSHNAKSEGSGSRVAMRNQESGFDLRRDVHSHPFGGPNDLELLQPSGVAGGNRGDIPAAAQLTAGNKRGITPVFQIYSGYLKRYVNYNGRGIIK